MMRIKRALSILLVCCLLLGILPPVALAAETDEDAYTDAEVEISPEMAANLVSMLTGEEVGEPIKTDDGYVFDMPESMVDELTAAVDKAADEAGIDTLDTTPEDVLPAEVKTPTAEDDGANALPEDYVDNSNDALYAMLEEIANTPMPLSDDSLAGTKIDLFFVIDSTGSMSSYINNVKTNVAEFARTIGATGATLRLGLIDYRDITADGSSSTTVHELDHSPWMAVPKFITELTGVRATGGGDTPETPIDALGYLVKSGVGWNSDAYKFAMLITDAGYKTNNNHGIADMDEMIRLLTEKEIYVSTITPSGSVAREYGELAAMTGGIQIPLSGNFADDMMDYAKSIMSTVGSKKDTSRDYILQVLDGETGLPVEGATVTWDGGSTTTVASGTAKITAGEPPVKNVQVTRDGYLPNFVGDLYEDSDVELTTLTVDPKADEDDIPTLTPSMFKNPASGDGTLRGPSLEFMGKKFNLIDNVDISFGLPLFSSSGRSRDVDIGNGMLKIAHDAENKVFKVKIGETKISGTDFKDPYSSYWEDDYQRYKSLVKLFDSGKADKDIYNEFRTLRKNNRQPKKKGDIVLPVDFDFVGYAEVSYASGSLDIMEGGVVIAAETKTWERTASFPPQPWIFVKVTFKMDLKGTFAFIKVEGTAKASFEPKINLDFDAESTVTLNAGVRRLAYVGGGLKGNLDASLELPLPEGKLEKGLNVTLSGKFRVEFKLLGIEKSKDFGNIGPATLYPWGSGRSIETYSLGDSDLEGFTSIGRPSPLLLGRSGEHFFFRENAAYEDSAPQLVQLPDGAWLLVWIDDVESRPDATMTGLYYSYKTADGEWSEPALVDDDGTGDFMPTLALAADGTPVLVWQNSKTAWTSVQDDLEVIAADIELKAAVYNQTSNTFGAASTLVSNNRYDTAVQVIPNSSTGAAVYWIETDPSNLLLGEDMTSTIYQSVWDGSAWGTPSELTKVGSLNGFAVGQIGSSNCVAYADGGDVFCSINGGSFTRQMTASGDASSLQIADGSLYWSDADGLHSWNGSTTTTFDIAAEDFSVLTSTDGQKAMIIRQYTDEANELFASVYNTVYGWSAPVQISEYGNLNLSTPSAVLDNDGTIYWACGRFATETEGDEIETTGSDLVVDSHTPKADIEVIETAYISEMISEGEETYAMVDLINHGLTSKDISATIQIDGGETQSAGIYTFSEAEPASIDTIKAGENLSAGIKFIAPSKMNGETVTISFKGSSGEVLGTATAKLPAAAPDMLVTEAIAEKTEDGRVMVAATFSNIGDADASNVTLIVTQEGSDTILARTPGLSFAAGAEPQSISYMVNADLTAKTPYDYKRFIVTAELPEGEERITGNNSDSALIAPEIPTAITINGDKEVPMKGGQTLALSCAATPTTAPVAEVWMSSRTSVATVSAEGVVSAWGDGEADIIVTHIRADGSTIQDSIRVTVTEGISNGKGVSGVSIKPKDATIGVGGNVTLVAEITPSTAENKAVTWFVDKTDVVRITPNEEEGTLLVEGLAEGEAKVSIRTDDGAYTDTVTVKVSGRYIPVSTETREENYISISASDNGEIIPTTHRAAQGERMSFTVQPSKGYELDTLTVTDIHGRAITLRDLGDNRYSFIMPGTNVTVEANFVKIRDEAPSTPVTPEEDEPFTGLGTPGISGIVLNPANMPFTDVRAGDWFYDNVDYVWKHYLMSGVSDTQFNPGATTSRAMIWTVLARMNNVRTDINPGSTWYERGMLWAMEHGVTDGSSPMAEITREQLATMLWRNAGSPGVSADLSRFSDSGSVSGYAQSAVRWAVSNGILNGSDGKLNPQGTATRAQVAAMVMRYGERIGA